MSSTTARRDGMARVPEQTYRMGSDHHYAEERPAHPVAVDAFWVDTHQVTNGQFAGFVADTGYVTVAERPLDPADIAAARTRRRAASPATRAEPRSIAATTASSHGSGCPAR